MTRLSSHNGKPSAKRLAGFVLLGVGVACRVFIVIMSYVKPTVSGATAIQATDIFFLIGGALLGLGVLEGVKIGGGKDV